MSDRTFRHIPTRESFGGSFVSPDVADVFHFMFGVPDHDQHVKRYRVYLKDRRHVMHWGLTKDPVQ